VKEEIKRIMKLVQDGKLSPEDAAELIDAFQSGDDDRETPPPPPSDAKGADSAGKEKDPFKSMIDFIEGIGKEVTESVDWKTVAQQMRESTKKGLDQVKVGIDQIKQGKVNWSWFSAYETREITLPLTVSEGKTLRIENPIGDVRITGGHAEGSVRAHAKVRGMDSDEALEKAEAYTIIIEESDHQVLIRQPDVSGLNVNLDVHLNTEAGIEIRTVSGDITVADTKGAARVHTMSGGISLKGLDGAIEVHSQSGDLTLSDSQSTTATLEVKTGDITLTKVKGNLAARSASGDVKLLECGGKTISVESVTGDVAVDLIDPVSGSVSVRTVNGDAEVRVADGSDCRVSLSTLKGDVTCSVELVDEARQSQHVTGRLGDGNGTLDVSAVNGDIDMALRNHAAHEA